MLVEVCHLPVVSSQTNLFAFWPSLILCQCKLKKPTTNRLQWLSLTLWFGLSENYHLIKLNLIVLTLILTFYHAQIEHCSSQSKMSSPRLFKIACIGINLCFLSVMKNSFCMFNYLIVLGHITATSVSML